MEELIGFGIDHSGITFQVKSGGCTKKDSFRFKFIKTELVQIQLVRTKVDNCEALLPFGTKINYSFEEIGLKSGQAFSIGNSLIGHYKVPFTWPANDID